MNSVVRIRTTVEVQAKNGKSTQDGKIIITLWCALVLMPRLCAMVFFIHTLGICVYKYEPYEGCNNCMRAVMR